MSLQHAPADDVPIIGQMRKRGYRRVTHGGFLKQLAGLSADNEFLRDLLVWQALLPDDAVFTSYTAARLRRWALPRLPDDVPVFASVEGARRPRRPGLVCSRLRRPTEPTYRQGFPVDTAEEILLRMARELELLDMRCVLEAAIQVGDVDEQRMEAILRSGRPGVVTLRAAWVMRTGKAQSMGESVLQQFLEVMQIAYEPQKSMHDRDGRLLGVADTYIPALEAAHEFDGEVHRGKVQHRKDLRRDSGLARAGVTRRGYTLDDLLNHASVLMHELDRDLGRPHRLQRLHRWQALVNSSLYSAAGRERLSNRWHREMGGLRWSFRA